MPLTEEKRQQLDGIINQMIQNKESDENINFVVNDFKGKYEDVKDVGSKTQIQPLSGPGQSEISAAPPKWVNYGRVGTELGGLIFGKAPGYAAARILNKYGVKALGYREPVRTGAAEEKEIAEKSGYMGLAKEMMGKELTPELVSKMEESYQRDKRVKEAIGGFGGGVPSEVANALKEGTIMGMGGEVGGSLVSKVIAKVANKFPGMAKATTPEMQAFIDLAKRENVSVLVPDVTGNRPQALLFNAADKAIGGSGVTQKAAARTIQDMDAYGNRILSQLGGQFEPTVMGDVAREGMKVKFEPIQEMGNKLYDNFVNQSLGVKIPLNNTTKVVNEIRNSKEFQYLPGQIKSILNKVFSDLNPIPQKMPNVRYGGLPEDILGKLQAQGISKTMGMDELESIRRALSKLSFHKEISGDVGNRISTQILKTIDEDMTMGAEKVSPLAKSALEDARRFQKENIFGIFKGKTEIGKPSIGTRIQTVQNEDFLKIISKGNLTELQDLKKVLPGETMQVVKRAWLTDLFTKYQRILQVPEGQKSMVNVPRVSSELDKYGDKYLKTLFNDNEFKMINDFRKLAQHISYAEKIASNPSGTAQTLATIQIITGGGFATYGTVKRDPILAASGLIFTFGGPYAVAKFMTSSGGFRYMTTGIKESPLIADIVSNSIKTAGVIGTQANLEVNKEQENKKIQEQTVGE